MWLIVGGALNGNQLESGGATLFAPYRAVIPTLPDPYAANFDFERRQDVDAGWASATVTWPPHRPRCSTSACKARMARYLARRLGKRRPHSWQALRVPARLRALCCSTSRATPTNSASRFQSLPGRSPCKGSRWFRRLATWPCSRCRRSRGSQCSPPDRVAAILRSAAAARWRRGDNGRRHDARRPGRAIPLLRTYHDAVNQRRHFTSRLPLPFGLIAHLDTRGRLRRSPIDIHRRRQCDGDELPHVLQRYRRRLAARHHSAAEDDSR